MFGWIFREYWGSWWRLYLYYFNLCKIVMNFLCFGWFFGRNQGPGASTNWTLLTWQFVVLYWNLCFLGYFPEFLKILKWKLDICVNGLILYIGEQDFLENLKDLDLFCEFFRPKTCFKCNDIKPCWTGLWTWQFWSSPFSVFECFSWYYLQSL